MASRIVQPLAPPPSISPQVAKLGYTTPAAARTFHAGTTPAAKANELTSHLYRPKTVPDDARAAGRRGLSRGLGQEWGAATFAEVGRRLRDARGSDRVTQNGERNTLQRGWSSSRDES